MRAFCSLRGSLCSKSFTGYSQPSLQSLWQGQTEWDRTGVQPVLSQVLLWVIGHLSCSVRLGTDARTEPVGGVLTQTQRPHPSRSRVFRCLLEGFDLYVTVGGLDGERRA